MVADLFHYEHAEFLEIAKTEANSTMGERIAAVGGCRYVHEAVALAPRIIDRAWKEKDKNHSRAQGGDCSKETPEDNQKVSIKSGLLRVAGWTWGGSADEISRRCKQAKPH